ncbi:M24 family metallopeptidase [Deinococcus pimensis]|uniref:M24 family metallopeptidase n=1 Tax=Deinococcus pimensis TaxID=309888 RepID=UPI000482FB40|nr:M24 family metallopeptidase [Deinococcus pimensis]
MQDALTNLRGQLQGTDLDGWLVYDFQGSNPLARTLLGLPEGAHLTRRYFVWVPREGRPALLHHRIEGGTWAAIGAGADLDRRPYSAHEELDAALRDVLSSARRIAMEYSPRGDVPYVSRVDAGTLERVRETGVDVVTSADLLQALLQWSPEDLAAHRRAVAVLMDAKDAGFRLVHDRLTANEPVRETQVQAEIMRVIEAGGLVTDHPAIVGFGANAADPHYAPGGEHDATLERGQCVLIDLWGQEPGRPNADVTWMAFAGEPDAEFTRAWQAVAAARDAAVELMRREHGALQGWQVDRAARDLLTARGYGEHFTHRLGHNLGVLLHGPGANLDDLETHDTRRLTTGLAVTVEPGVYPRERGYGIRSEVNVYLAPDGPEVTTPVQHTPYVLGVGDWETARATALGENVPS